ncbi:MAG: AAA domain-containing protein, partial [Myxococcaceae bacterium]
GAPPSLYADLLASFPELDGEKRKAIRSVVEEALEKGELTPLQEASEEGLLRQLADMLGVPRSNGSLDEESAVSPRLVRNAVLFLVPRVTGMGAVYESFLQRLHALAALPKGLALAVGDDSASPPKQEDVEETELYFTKPANDAQQRIARRIDSTGAVLVQGPPGTGKTHTIANLIGHFLAQGKTVLVTAQTSRALRVLRDQVVEPLKPLCVSVLDSDADSRAELESAINTIVAKLNHSAAEYDRAAEGYERQRKLITKSLEQRQRKLREALEAEVTELTAGELKLSPNEAARRLGAGVGKHDWILGPLSPRARIPINDESIRALYKLNAELTPADEAELRHGVPDPDELLTGDELKQLSESLGKPLPGEAPRWGALSDKLPAKRLQGIASKLRALVDELEPRPKWAWSCVQAMLLGGKHTAPWDELIERMDTTGPQIAALRHSLVEHEVRLDVTMDPDEELPTARELLAHVSSGGNLGWLTLTANASWKRLLEKIPVNGRRAETEREVRAIHDTLVVEQLRRQLRRRWDVLLGQEGFPLEGEDRLTVEETALSALPELRQSVRWARDEWPSCVHQLEMAGIPWPKLLDSTKAKPPHAELRRVLVCARTVVLPGLEHDLAAHQRRGDEMKRIAARERLERFPRSTPARKALSALESLNVEAYQEAAAEIARLSALLGPATKRERLLSALWAAAPTWAERIRARLAPHQGPDVPGDIAQAWEHRMIAEALDRRGTQDVDQLQKEIAQLTREMQETTSLAVENRAWAAQARRTDRTQHRALMSWLDVVKRLGKGHSKRAEEYRKSARRQLETARAAVPVWIMPLSRVAESFGPDQPLFDVVILDEASQCDVSALVAFSLGQ